MNRLWVRLSLVIVFVVIIVALSPGIIRRYSPPPERLPRPEPPMEIPAEQIDSFQAGIERRIWTNISSMLLVGAVLALAAGVMVSRWLVSPLEKLEEGARAVAEHQLGHRVPEQGSAEMRSVARSFNRMADELEHQEKLRNNLLADVTHELRHPVHILQGNLRAILDGVYPLEMEEIARLLDQTDQLTTLVEDLHQLALAEAQQLPLHKQEIDLVKIIRTSIDVSQPMLSSKDIVLDADIPPEPILCEVDEVRIRQVFQNILNNAFHHTPQEGAIEVSLAKERENVRISVSDTGAGILPEQLPHIFDRFYQTDSNRSRETGGTGLGLAIAKAIVESHGGKIIAHSPGVGQGSTFTITLPLIDTSSAG